MWPALHQASQLPAAPRYRSAQTEPKPYDGIYAEYHDSKYFTSNELDVNGMQKFKKELLQGALPKLEDIVLSGSPIGDKGLGHLAEAMDHGALKHLQHLKLVDTSVGDEGFAQLMTALYKNNIPIATLDLSSNTIGVEGISTFIKNLLFVPSKNSLQRLILYNNDINNEGMKLLTNHVLIRLPKLEKLDLRTNQISDDGIKSFVNKFVNTNLSNLTDLDLRDNKISKEGVNLINESLNASTTTFKLRFKNLDNQVGAN